jgi:hypothetical protein
MKLVVMLLLCVSMPIGLVSAVDEILEERTQSFTIVLRASVAEVTPLFGPVREAEWAPGWTPHFLHLPEGAQREGIIFTTSASG